MFGVYGSETRTAGPIQFSFLSFNIQKPVDQKLFEFET